MWVIVGMLDGYLEDIVVIVVVLCSVSELYVYVCFVYGGLFEIFI